MSQCNSCIRISVECRLCHKTAYNMAPAQSSPLVLPFGTPHNHVNTIMFYVFFLSLNLSRNTFNSSFVWEESKVLTGIFRCCATNSIVVFISHDVSNTQHIHPVIQWRKPQICYPPKTVQMKSQ